MNIQSIQSNEDNKIHVKINNAPPETNLSVNTELCVNPTQGETQWEAFHSIISQILGAAMYTFEDDDAVSESKKIIYSNKEKTQEQAFAVLKQNLDKNGYYTRLCNLHPKKICVHEIWKWGDDDLNENDMNTFIKEYIYRCMPVNKKSIVFLPIEDEDGGTETHYICISKNGGIENPYNDYQLNESHGYCQMFAFFIAIGDTEGFIKHRIDNKNITMKIFEQNLDILAINTQKCGDKLFKLIEKNNKIKKIIEEGFDEIFMNNEENINHYGITKGTSFDTYIEHFKIVNKNLDMIKCYMRDQYKKYFGNNNNNNNNNNTNGSSNIGNRRKRETNNENNRLNEKSNQNVLGLRRSQRLINKRQKQQNGGQPNIRRKLVGKNKKKSKKNKSRKTNKSRKNKNN